MSGLRLRSIDVCIPTWNSDQVLEGTLECLGKSAEVAEIAINRLVVIDNRSADDTVAIVRTKGGEIANEVVVNCKRSTLPKARELAVRAVETEWFLFLDDDVRLSDGYLRRLVGCTAPHIGAVQGRKASSVGEPWEWIQRRVYRGGTHATLIRRRAVSGVTIPEEVTVLEDEFLRRYVESNGYVWVFDHAARFDHDSLGRHPLGWRQGVIAGKYKLMPCHAILLMIGDAIVSMRSPFGRVLLLCGWLYGRLCHAKDV